MKQRIDQLVNGIFEYEAAKPVLSVPSISLNVRPGDRSRGSFEISSGSGRRMKGFVYSSDPRMSFEPSAFQGIHNRIVYLADTEGLHAGEAVSGTFTICCDQGELSVPWQISIEDVFTSTNGLEKVSMMTPQELADLSRKDMPLAAAKFADPEYQNILKETDRARYSQYLALIRNEEPIRALEEYLISSGIKEPADINLEENLIVMKRPERSWRREMVLKKQGWGYQEIQISSDSRFLRPEKAHLTTLDFVGDSCTIGYVIDTNFLHAGRNLGRISISTCYRTIFLDVVIESSADSDRIRSRRVQKMMQKKLLSLYIDLRLKRIEMQNWIDRCMTVISSYRRAGGTDIYAELFLVQLFFADGKKIKGKRMLQELSRQTDRFLTNEQYAFYLYLTTFFEQDAEYVDQVETQVEQMFLRRRDSWVLAWILLYLQERYMHDEAAKLEAIRSQVQYGCCSPILYIEALTIFREHPYWMRKLGSFEKRVLLFGIREHYLTDELAAHTGNLVLPGMKYDSVLMRILKGCYEQTGSPDLLKSICQLLIDNNCKRPGDFEWYALGVAAELRVGGLYDSYMETMDVAGIEKMPQIIRMYFSYSSTLSYHRKAAIYRSISDNRENVPAVYRSSRPGIEHFIIQQLELGRIDSNLAVLYERFLTRRLLGPALAAQLVKVLFTFKVTCKNPNMTSVIVSHDCLRQEEIVPLKNGVARVQIYTQQARIFLTDENGHRYTSPSLYMAQRYLDSPLLLSFCRELAPEQPGLIVYYCAGEEPVTAQSLPYFVRACQMELFEEWFLEKLRRKVLFYYTEHTGAEGLYDFLKSIRYAPYIEAGKTQLMALLTQEGMYEEAFHLLELYGTEGVDPSCLVRICAQNVLIREYEEDPMLLYFCFRCYQCGKYDDNILTYLLSYYEGPIEEMKRLWETGHQYDQDTMVLEEKILSLLLFMRAGGDNTEQIFWSYYRKLGRRKLCRAYVNLKSYEYLVKNLPVGTPVFSFVEQGYLAGIRQSDVSLLALLQYYSSLPALDEEREQIAGSLLNLYSSKEIRFDFFRKFPEKLLTRCYLDDRIFLEYVANPKHSAMVFTRTAGSREAFHAETMKNCFEGIFVKEFILFEGEQIECYIEEYNGDEKVHTTDRRIISARTVSEGASDRYALISRMSGAAGRGDLEELEKELLAFEQLDDLTKALFTLV